ncbi:MAG: 4-hydroxy-tetrahydrodipicolinate synthase [Desulfovibrio sp.]|jgi:4-hydroxy-tetrahydrodipicolinate synthase|nr:4-hydroxy-tetrahydrodipicolinate synthase [Desulfovibrio sp.]
MLLQGAFTALVTPFRNGKVDEEAFRRHIETQIHEGIDGLVPCGTTGESATLSHEEHREVVRICIDQTAGRVPVIAGAGSNNTREAEELIRFAREAGADAVLLITPYYNKPSQEGLYAHFKALDASAPIPAVLYNVPGRTGVNIAPETMARIFKDLTHVTGIKDATGNLTQVSDIIEQCGEEFSLLSGDDFTALPTLALGGKGVISVIANIAPRAVHDMCAAWFSGNAAEARRLHYELAPLCRACFLETNPVPVKTALGLLGHIEDYSTRLPLAPLAPANEARLRDLLRDCGYKLRH